MVAYENLKQSLKYKKSVHALMRIETKESHWDILAILALSPLFTLVVVLFPDLSLIRILLGIPFLTFFPGYVLTALLFPRKRVKIERDIENENGTIKKERKNIQMGRGRFQPKKGNKVETNNLPDEKGIDNLIRIVLSFGLSLGIVPVIGFMFNELYQFNQDLFGLRLLPIIVVLFIFIMLIGFIAIIRRERIPKKDRFQVRIKIGPFTDSTIQDKMITSVLVILIIISALSTIYFYKYYHENEKFTEFYILGPEKKIANYPTKFHINQEKMIYLGVENHEFTTENYTLDIYIGNDPKPTQKVQNFIGLNFSEEYIYENNIELDHGNEYLTECSFKINEPGIFLIYFVLYKDEKPYRELMLRTQVFEPSDLVFSENDTFAFYITGPNGIPSDFTTSFSDQDPLEIEFGLISHYDRNQEFNVTINTTYPDNWFEFNETMNRAIITNSTGSFFSSNIFPGESISIPVEIQFQEGTWIVTFAFRVLNIDLEIHKNFKVK